MAHILENQRATFIAALIGTKPEVVGLSNAELLALYLASLGFALGSVDESLQAWAVANSVPQTRALTTIGA